MRMRQVKSIELTGKKPTDLAPGGYHIMLLDLKEQLREGETVIIRLEFERDNGVKESVEVSAKVRPLTSSAALEKIQ